MHLKSVSLLPEKFPTRDCFPFDLKIFQTAFMLPFNKKVTFFIGENGTGKSTLLKALARKAGIHIWENTERKRFKNNPFEKSLYKSVSLDWHDGFVPGAFFGSDIFRDFTNILDEWAAADPGVLSYFGGESLRTQSHGQSLMSYFRSRFKIRGLYLMDEPETALSPKSQIELLKILGDSSQNTEAQFIIATHSPLLMACPGSEIYCFNSHNIQPVTYEHTEHYRMYSEFLNNRDSFLKQ